LRPAGLGYHSTVVVARTLLRIPRFSCVSPERSKRNRARCGNSGKADGRPRKWASIHQRRRADKRGAGKLEYKFKDVV
jgi:hypothetical protein